MPKIALLFLTKGPLPHEATWRAWFEAASHLLPRNELLKRCNREPTEVLKELVAECEALQPYAVDAIASQLLYSVYIHAPPSFQGYPSGALWDGYLIQERVDTKWGDHSLSIATRALISAALVNPGNQWFVLVSESDIPLYDPLTFYLQLMSENKSRVNACEGGNSMSHRWSDLMTTSEMNISHWRKSSQWFAMQRRHAQVVADDVEVNQSFEKYCRYDLDPLLGRVRDCISDEHYIPTLFAAKGLESEMDCEGWGIAALDWGRGGAHPKSYGPEEVTPDLITGIRNTGNAIESQLSAQYQFTKCQNMIEGFEKGEKCSEIAAIGAATVPFQPMLYGPVLTARKFPPQTAAAVESVAHSCIRGIELLTGKPCR